MWCCLPLNTQSQITTMIWKPREVPVASFRPVFHKHMAVPCTDDHQNLVWIVSGLELVWSASTWSVDCKRMMTSSASRHFLAIEQHSWQILFRFCYSTVPMVLIYQNEMVRGELARRVIFLEGTWVHHFSSKNAVSQLKEHQYVSGVFGVSTMWI